jgi:hypothetical protein
MKRKLNSDGQQFHQYQQNVQSALTFTHWTQIKNNHDICSQQFHQYQQNEQSPLTFTHWTQNKNRLRHMTLDIQVMAWDRHKHYITIT